MLLIYLHILGTCKYLFHILVSLCCMDKEGRKSAYSIHLIPKWPPFRYSFVFIQIRPWCLVQGKIFLWIFSSRTRHQRLIWIKTKEYLNDGHSGIRSIVGWHQLWSVSLIIIILLLLFPSAFFSPNSTSLVGLLTSNIRSSSGGKQLDLPSPTCTCKNNPNFNNNYFIVGKMYW